MTAYNQIAGTEIDVDSPITDYIFQRLRDNPVAMTEGSSGAPQVEADGIDDQNITYNRLSTDAINGLNQYADNRAFSSTVLFDGTANHDQTATLGSSIANFDMITAEVQTSGDDWVYFIFSREHIRLNKIVMLETKKGSGSSSSNGHSFINFSSVTSVHYTDYNVTAYLKRVVGHKTTV